jgi:hypothetical protein
MENKERASRLFLFIIIIKPKNPTLSSPMVCAIFLVKIINARVAMDRSTTFSMK